MNKYRSLGKTLMTLNVYLKEDPISQGVDVGKHNALIEKFIAYDRLGSEAGECLKKHTRELITRYRALNGLSSPASAIGGIKFARSDQNGSKQFSIDGQNWVNAWGWGKG